MVANILIASGFFALGFLIGGAFVLSTCWKYIRKLHKELKNAKEDPVIIRIHEAKL